MNLTEFIQKYDGQGVDTDNAFGFQCMDLMHKYCQDVLGLPLAYLRAPTAKDVYLGNNVLGIEYFTKTDNTPTGIPIPGDIILWGTKVGESGHVAIFVDGSASEFHSFDQNWPVGSKCHIQKHDYKGVLGWLHYKQPATSTTAPSTPTIPPKPIGIDFFNKEDNWAWSEVIGHNYSKDPTLVSPKEIQDAKNSALVPWEWLKADQKLRLFPLIQREAVDTYVKEHSVITTISVSPSPTTLTSSPEGTPNPAETREPRQDTSGPVLPSSGRRGSGSAYRTGIAETIKKIWEFFTVIKERR